MLNVAAARVLLPRPAEPSRHDAMTRGVSVARWPRARRGLLSACHARVQTPAAPPVSPCIPLQPSGKPLKQPLLPPRMWARSGSGLHLEGFAPGVGLWPSQACCCDLVAKCAPEQQMAGSHLDRCDGARQVAHGPIITPASCAGVWTENG